MTKLLLDEKIKLIMKERESLMTIGVKDAKILYTMTAEFYHINTKEFMQRCDYDTAVKMMFYEEEKKK